MLKVCGLPCLKEVEGNDKEKKVWVDLVLELMI